MKPKETESQKMKILIAEDDFTSRAVLVAVLEREGHEVTVAVNAAEAWQTLRHPGAGLRAKRSDESGGERHVDHIATGRGPFTAPST